MNPNPSPLTSPLWISAGQAMPVSIPFECQALFDHAGDMVGMELLYRGIVPQSWIHVDAPVLRHLGRVKFDAPCLYVNVANESLMVIPDDAFVLASEKNNVVLELSEMFTAQQTIAHVAAKVNRLSGLGVKFAIDHFGSGFDGLHRLYSLEQVACIKVDGAFLKLCQKRNDAALMLRSLIAEWKSCGIAVAAEWIETPELLAFAHAMDFDYMQGWYMDKLYGMAEQELAA